MCFFFIYIFLCFSLSDFAETFTRRESLGFLLDVSRKFLLKSLRKVILHTVYQNTNKYIRYRNVKKDNSYCVFYKHHFTVNSYLTWEYIYMQIDHSLKYYITIGYGSLFTLIPWFHVDGS